MYVQLQSEAGLQHGFCKGDYYRRIGPRADPGHSHMQHVVLLVMNCCFEITITSLVFFT